MQHGSYPTPNIIGSTEPHIISLSPEDQLSFTGRVDCVAKSRQRRWQALVGGSGTCCKPALSQLYGYMRRVARLVGCGLRVCFVFDGNEVWRSWRRGKEEFFSVRTIRGLCAVKGVERRAGG
jgi:hypothetical protein